jgi:glycosyltransferase involved in cell wall biosynthesis
VSALAPVAPISDTLADAAPRMRILFLNPSGLFGGAERSLLDIIASIRAARPNWEMQLVAGSDGPLIRRARAMNVDTNILPMPPSLAQLGDSAMRGPAGASRARLTMAAGILGAAIATNRYTATLTREIERVAPTLIHTNGFKMHLLGAWAARRKTPVIWHIHDYVGARPVMSRLMRMQASRCAAAIANSDSVRREFRLICNDRIETTTVYNAVDLDQFSPAGATLDLDALAGMPAAPLNTVRVGLVATMARWKGHEVFLRAIAGLPDSARSRVRAYVIGGAIYPTRGSQLSIDELRATCGQLGISDHVGFTGFVDDVATAIRALDIVVHASTEPEPFGLAIIEAMSCAKPVIASAAGGAAEVAQLSGGVLMHPPGDSAALARCIERLVVDPSDRASLGAAGRASAEKLFRRSRLADQIVPIFERVAGVKPRCA